MAIDTTDLSTINKLFNTNLVEALTSLQENTQMEDEHFATVAGAGFQSAMDNSVRAIGTFKHNELITKQVVTETNKALLVVADTGVKVSQKFSIDADVVRKDNQAVKQNLLLDKQALKVVQDTVFSLKQGVNMDKQVQQNCIIQAMDKAEGYNMGIGTAGLIPSQDMHTNFFIQNKALMLHGGITFNENGEAVYDNIVLGTYNVSPTAS